MQVRNWLYVEDFATAIDDRARARRGGRGLQRRRPRRAGEHRRRPPDPRAHRPRRVADQPRPRPARARPALLALGRANDRRSAGGPRSASTRASSAPSPGIATTSRGGGRSARASTASTTSASTARDRVPRRGGAGMTLRVLETKLDGLVLVEPEVHGDERGFLVETFSAPRWAEAGIDVEFVQDNHSRSVAGDPARPPLPARPRPGEARSLRPRGRSGTSPSTCAATPRPSASGRATSSTTTATASSSSRSASRTASACSASRPTSSTSSRASTTRRPRPGSPGTTPTSASTGRSTSPRISERDRSAPRLAEIAAELPF